MTTNAHLCRFHRWGKSSFAVTIPPALRREMGLVQNDVLGVRVVRFQNRTLLICEKVSLTALGNLKEIPAEMLQAQR